MCGHLTSWGQTFHLCQAQSCAQACFSKDRLFLAADSVALLLNSGAEAVALTPVMPQLLTVSHQTPQAPQGLLDHVAACPVSGPVTNPFLLQALLRPGISPYHLVYKGWVVFLGVKCVTRQEHKWSK